MEKTKVDQFLMINAGKFPDFAHMAIREKLEKKMRVAKAC